jgi:hypothetical protein
MLALVCRLMHKRVHFSPAVPLITLLDIVEYGVYLDCTF